MIAVQAEAEDVAEAQADHDRTGVEDADPGQRRAGPPTARGMDGSPTILVEGHAVGATGEAGSLSCRLTALVSVNDLAATCTRLRHA